MMLLSLRAEQPVVVVTTFPLQWVVQGLGGEDIQIEGYAPERAEKGPDLDAAALIVLNGAGHEPWAQGVELPTLFRSSEAVLEVYSEARNFDERTRALFHRRSEGITWLDPLHLRLQARAVAERLAPFVSPEALASRLQQVEADLDTLEAELRAHPRLRREGFLALHPALEALTPGYGWIVRSPDADESLETFYETFPARLALSLGPPEPARARELQEQFRMHTFPFDPGLYPVDGPADWPALMRRNFRTLTSGFLP